MLKIFWCLDYLIIGWIVFFRIFMMLKGYFSKYLLVGGVEREIFFYNREMFRFIEEIVVVVR